MNAADSSLLTAYRAAEGTWTRRDAAHLLWRTQHGASAEDVDRAHGLGLEATVDRLLTPQAQSAEFQASEALLQSAAQRSGNIEDLKAWWAHRLLKSADPLVEKMTLFWHNHFATSNAKVRSSEHMSSQNELFRKHALGSFRELVHAIASDVAMLVWLDSNANRNRQPNENFARELLELFTLGVGNYTEKDIQEAARAFTGWHVRGGKFWSNRIQHDTRSKTVLGKTGNLDGGDIVEICLQQPAAVRFLATKLLKNFVMPDPLPAAIEAVAESIRRNDYAMRPVLRELLTSSLFYSAEVRASMIKSPAELVLGSHRALDSRANLQASVQLMTQLGQNLFEPPTVKGWEGNRLWIHSASLLARANFASELTTGSRVGAIADPEETATKHGWQSANDGILHYSELLLNRDAGHVTAAIAERLRQTSGSTGLKLRSAIYVLMTLPEYQLM
jgi:uncharacterized protein (DUF1800 family)